MRSLWTLVLVILVPGLAAAQISHGGTPPSLDPALAPLLEAKVPVVQMTPVDVEALRAEDDANEGRRDMPWRFGQPLPVALDSDLDGVWETLPGGDRVWRLGIASPGAVSLNLAFDRYVLPPGAQLYVRSADGASVLGAFTDANNKADGKFATSLIPADEIVLEYVEPAGAPFPGELGLVNVTHGYRGPMAATKSFGSSGACMHNVYCPPMTSGWEDQVRSVVMLVSGYSGFCTGALINNTAQDGTPYFLTANHCYSDPSYWVMWFNWESPDCNDPYNSPAHDSISGAWLVATDSSSDFALLELSSSPPASYGAYYAGWDHSGNTPQSAACIHHPSGDIKKISMEGNQVYASGYFWQVGPWDAGVTEQGSSGSPLFDQNHRIVGQLYGGSSYCAGSYPDSGTDIFGAFHESWDGPSSNQRLRDWLDPGNTGVSALDGYDPGTPQADADAGVLHILDPADGSLHCNAPVPAEVTIQNYGNYTLTSVDIRWRVDGGNWSQQAWSGSLASGTTANVVLPGLSVGAGVHTLEVETQDPNGQADGNPSNDDASATFEVVGAAGIAGPVQEGFESNTFPPSGWDLMNGDNEVEWERTVAAGGWGTSAGSARFDNYTEQHTGAEDVLLLPMVDMNSMAPPVAVDFDLAYARYDSQYWDEFGVAVSADCGQNWDVIYDEWSTGLATAPDFPDAFVPAPGEWRTETLDLSNYGGEPNLWIAFVNISGWGNHLYLDNVDLHGATGDDDAGDDDTGDDDAGDDDVGDDDASDDDAGDDDGGDDDAGDDDGSDDDVGDDDAGDDDLGDDDLGDDDAGDDDTSDDSDDYDTGFGGLACACEQGRLADAPGAALWLGLLGLGVALRTVRRR